MALLTLTRHTIGSDGWFHPAIQAGCPAEVERSIRRPLYHAFTIWTSLSTAYPWYHEEWLALNNIRQLPSPGVDNAFSAQAGKAK